MQAQTRLNGCHNRKPFKSETLVQDGHSTQGQTLVPQFKLVPFRMSPDCHYTHTELGQKDPGCKDCNHRAQTATH